MHLEHDPHPHPHPHPAPGSRPGFLPWLLIAAALGTSAFLALRGSGKPAAGEPSPEDRALAARFREAVSVLEQYDYPAAYGKFAEVAAARPRWAAAHFNAGLAALNFREDKENKKDYFPIAEAEFREALKLDPGSLHARFCLALLFKFEQRLDEAFEAFQAVARADPTDPFALYEYGALLADRGLHAEAKEALEAAVRIQPAFASALYKLGQVVYRNLKEEEKRVEALKRFQSLRDSNEEVITGIKYGEAGKYASAIRDPFPPGPSPARGEVRGAAPATPGDRSTVGAPAVSRARPDGSPSPPAFCVGDLDGDGVLDLVLLGQPAGGEGRTEVWKGEGSGTAFRKLSEIDADGDSAALGDLDGDGDLDLVVAGEGSLLVFANDGKAGLTPSKMKFPPAGPGFPLRVLIFDADSDWDLDVLVLRQLPLGERCETSLELLNSNRDGAFEDIAAKVGIARLPLSAEGALFADLDGDIDLDVLVLARPREESLVLLNDRAWRYRRIPVSQLGGTAALLAKAGLAPPVEEALAAASPAGAAESAIPIADPSGRPFSLTAQAGSPLQVIPVGPAPRTWIGISLEGKKEPKPRLEWANLSGVGATVEVRFGERSVVRQLNCAGAGEAYGTTLLIIDLEGAEKIDFVRILWPDGVLQSEHGLPAGQVHRIVEIQRKPTSCPILFTWDGARFRYVGDFLGVGGLGYLEAPGVYSSPDPTEVIELPRLAPARGPGGVEELLLSVIEPLEECTYLDFLALLAVDAPAGVTVHPDEIFPVRAPAREPGLLAFGKALFPDRAADGGGRDVTEELRTVDRVYAGARTRDRRFPGAAEPHAVVLEWEAGLPRGEGDPRAGGPRPVLFLYGYVEYGYSTSNFAAAQARVALHAPTVSVERRGAWVPLRTEWGFPAGTPRWMTVDLGGSLEEGDRRLRIDSDMEVYWDQAFLAEAEPIPLGDLDGLPRSFAVPRKSGAGAGGQPSGAPAGVRITALAPDRAQLRFRGFPRDSSPDGRLPKLYDYDDVSPQDPMKPFPGGYTRHGEVADLLGRPDDRFAILGEGDEVLLGFHADRLEAPAAGTTRTFFLAARGYCKDMDLYTAASDRVEPLPFRAMSAYPPPPEEVRRRSSAAALEDAARNDRVVEPLVIQHSTANSRQ